MDVINEPEKKITREQRRFQERISKEAGQVHSQLANKFLNFFINSDNPEGEEVQEKAKQIGAQWRLYCKYKGLIASVYPAIDQYCSEIKSQYLEAKEKPEPEPEPQPPDQGFLCQK